MSDHQLQRYKNKRQYSEKFLEFKSAIMTSNFWSENFVIVVSLPFHHETSILKMCFIKTVRSSHTEELWRIKVLKFRKTPRKTSVNESSHENYWLIFFDVCKTGLYQRCFPENFLEFFGTAGTKYSRMDQLKFVEGSL